MATDSNPTSNEAADATETDDRHRHRVDDTIQGYVHASSFPSSLTVPVSVSFLTNTQEIVAGTHVDGNGMKELDVPVAPGTTIIGVLIGTGPTPNNQPLVTEVLFGQGPHVTGPGNETSPRVRVVLSNYQITSLVDHLKD